MTLGPEMRASISLETACCGVCSMHAPDPIFYACGIFAAAITVFLLLFYVSALAFGVLDDDFA